MWSQICSQIWNTLFVHPLRRLYLEGPAPLFWQSQPKADICAQLSGVPSKFWDTNLLECENTINVKFHSFMIMASTVGWCVCLYKIVSLLWFRYMVVGPILRQFRESLAADPMLNLNNK